MEEIPAGVLVSALGFVLGVIFGVTAQRTNFCTMGAISDAVFMGDWNRFRAWMLAIAVAILGSQALHMTGTVDLATSIYLTSNLGWAGAIIGGLLFGFGMTMTGGCGNKTLVRLGAGNLKSVVVALFLGIFAYMTLRGLMGLARVELENSVNVDLSVVGMADQGMPAFLGLFGVLYARDLPLTDPLLHLGEGFGVGIRSDFDLHGLAVGDVPEAVTVETLFNASLTRRAVLGLDDTPVHDPIRTVLRVVATHQLSVSAR